MLIFKDLFEGALIDKKGSIFINRWPSFCRKYRCYISKTKSGASDSGISSLSIFLTRTLMTFLETQVVRLKNADSEPPLTPPYDIRSLQGSGNNRAISWNKNNY